MKQTSTLEIRSMAWIIIASFVIWGCNSNSEKKETSDTTVTDQTGKIIDTSTVRTTTVTLPTYLLTAANWRSLFSTRTPNGKVDMIYFKYGETNTGSGTVWNFNVFRALGASDEGESLNDLIDLPTVPTGPTLQFDLPYPYHQQVTIGNVRGLLGLSEGTNTIPDDEFKDVWLVPCIMLDPDGKELVYYRITEPANGGTACPATRQPNMEGRISSNPSPPARPCVDESGGCGSIQFLKTYQKDSLIKAAKLPTSN